MALIVCKNCGKPVSDTAAVCVHCGFELKPKEEQITTFFALPREKQNELTREFAQTNKELYENYNLAVNKKLPFYRKIIISMVVINFVLFPLVFIVGPIILITAAVLRPKNKKYRKYKEDYMVAFEKWLKEEKNLSIVWDLENE